MNDTPLQIIIAEDHPTYSFGVQQVLIGLEYIKVIGIVSDGKQLLHLINSVIPDLILMDINMPNLSGIDAAISIKKQHPQIKIIFLTMYEERSIINKCLQYGDGYLSKSSTAGELTTAINAVMAGQSFTLLNTNLNTPINKELSVNDELSKKHKLTKREIELILLLKEGMTTKEIAESLFLSYFTIETHRKNIFRKLEVKNLAGLINFATQNKITH
ncbi:response regulator transcription factor [Mucilaginibacter myungsuensis]|uniref:Response regulator transcription factor n=1 Tax=Mucilaginibacter myungsuensis TaxID=649104 RepID=A0A929PUS7_9SPHI|nr:response regulator transcription factor [Mucilaginibacter myungsuensis]MBE9660409.1 response regulator transcription factor [Mucilaginibacter myungsuensis]MDN3600452.1 response regulator transcription factor [Mucilaginibacter myungsuensis]